MNGYEYPGRPSEDIVTRLRERARREGDALLNEAADEIDKMRPVYKAALPFRTSMEASIPREDQENWKVKMQAFVDAIANAVGG